MSRTLLQETLETIFSVHFMWLSPLLFLLMIVIFADRLIDLIAKAVGSIKIR